MRREKKRSRSCNFRGGSRKSYGTATTAAGSTPNSTSQLIISRQMDDSGPAENKLRLFRGREAKRSVNVNGRGDQSLIADCFDFKGVESLFFKRFDALARISVCFKMKSIT